MMFYKGNECIHTDSHTHSHTYCISSEHAGACWVVLGVLPPPRLQEMAADFDNVLRLREHEFNLRLDEMRTVLLSHQIKVPVHRSGVCVCVRACVCVREHACACA